MRYSPFSHMNFQRFQLHQFRTVIAALQTYSSDDQEFSEEVHLHWLCSMPLCPLPSHPPFCGVCDFSCRPSRRRCRGAEARSTSSTSSSRRPPSRQCPTPRASPARARPRNRYKGMMALRRPCFSLLKSTSSAARSALFLACLSVNLLLETSIQGGSKPGTVLGASS